MEIKLGREKEKQEVSKITVIVNDVEYRLSVNQFNQLVLNKMQLGPGESSIIVKPSTSNEVRIE